MHLKAEKMSVQGMIRSMQAAVLMQTDLGDAFQKRADPGDNPLKFMEDLPANYLGGISSGQPERIKGGRWYFDKKVDMLIYRIDNSEGFKSELSGPARIRFKLRNAQKVHNSSKILSCGPNLCLVLAEPYTW